MRAEITFIPMTDMQIAMLTPEQVRMWVRDCERLRDENKSLRKQLADREEDIKYIEREARDELREVQYERDRLEEDAHRW